MEHGDIRRPLDDLSGGGARHRARVRSAAHGQAQRIERSFFSTVPQIDDADFLSHN
jgi:hypothetical protein